MNTGCRQPACGGHSARAIAANVVSVGLAGILIGCSPTKAKDVSYYEAHPTERDVKVDACMPDPKSKGGECRAAKLAAEQAYQAIAAASR
jgi:hypothetical protein